VQFLEGGAPGGDILDRAAGSGRGAGLVEHEAGIHFHPTIAAIPEAVADLVPAVVLTALDQGPELLQIARLVLRPDVIQERLAEGLGNGEAGDFLPGRVEEGPPAGGVGTEDDLLQIVDDLAEERIVGRSGVVQSASLGLIAQGGAGFSDASCRASADRR
jgi:hypothetical protein